SIKEKLLMPQLVMLRHGESVWNLEGRFTGWTDVPLTDRGKHEARDAGRILQRNGFSFDSAFCSVLKRAVETLNIVLEEMDCQWLSVAKSWRLNERHYGALQGEYKEKKIREVGEEQVRRWRRSYDERPPLLSASDSRNARLEFAYRSIDPSLIPLGESLQDTVSRVIPVLRELIEPELLQGRSVLVVAHGNSLRGLVKYLMGMTDKDVVRFEIATGVPLVFDLKDDLTYRTHRFLSEK
ncbi:MAG: 2,3-diphosphoglycerate-dependent phosphoglycerate mutase, partial [Cytophagales bacterium]|nr:2,3-diphosphoglycerate-dependent phosphoglycerate mutase [Cytophagales bacterium]